MRSGKRNLKRSPRVFIGSSTEGLELAAEVQAALDYCSEPTVWNQNVFALSRTTVEDLMSALEVFDFGVFILSPDDVIRIRKETQKAARDNVVFELGLFMGRLGRQRTFIVMPRGVKDFRLATDLLGVAMATFNSKRRDHNLAAALGPACKSIREAVRKRGPKPGKRGPGKIPRESILKKLEEFADKGVKLLSVLTLPNLVREVRSDSRVGIGTLPKVSAGSGKVARPRISKGRR